MGLTLLKVEDDDEFKALCIVFRAAFKDPVTPLWPLFSGDYRPDPAYQEVTFAETTQRFLAWHRSDPTSYWLKVVDDSSGEIVGGGRWAFYETGNPYDGHGDMEASWWPEGEPREIATTCLNQFLATSAKHMNRPHAYLNILFTHPEHRRRGVGSLIMNWGLERADKLGLESFIEATAAGKPCYERFGFEVIDTNQLHVEKKNPSKEWKEAESQLLPFTWWSMYKPAKHNEGVRAEVFS